MPCPCVSFNSKVCGKPSFVLNSKPYFKDYCFECIILSTWIAGQLYIIGRQLGKRGGVVPFIIPNTPEVVQRFEAQQEKIRVI